LVANGRRRRSFLCLEANGRRKKRLFFTSSHFSPKRLYLDLRLFPLILKFDFTMVLGRYLCLSPFPLAYKLRSRILMSQVPHTFIVNSIWLKIFFFTLKIMVSHMVMSYMPQTSQANKEPTSELSLYLMLMQHRHDEEPDTRSVCSS